ncbi:MAG: hypothetical protein E4H37_08530 [Gemmatimonadales bacterium]|nr:MAG: hypothetical protein E4H37_08530 [Gemmatimonadales bacterium]
MARPKALVDAVSEIARKATPRADKRAAPAPTLVSVNFQNGQSAYLDMSLSRSHVWAEVLQSLRETGQPAYVEVDEDSGVITELLLPRAVTVESITPREPEDGVNVALVISHARHTLNRSNARYDQLLRALESARKTKASVLVTEDLDTHEIIDVRPLLKQKKVRRR